jgi:hypothetical protein
MKKSRKSAGTTGLSRQEFGQILDDDVGAVLEQRLGLADAIHAHDDPEVARATGRYAGLGVFEDGAILGCRVK